MSAATRLAAWAITLVLLLSLCGCAWPETPPDDGRLHVVCTLFPPYDFVRQIAGDQVKVTLLLSPGQECHSYEPTPRDILDIQDCDLFIYGGGESESWVEDMLASIEGDRQVLSLLDCVEAVAEETPEGASHRGHHHDGGDDADHAHKDDVEYDEHVWTSPHNAIHIVRHITTALCALDAAHATEYQANSAAYQAALEELDAAFAAVVSAGARRTLVFADRFPFFYFAAAYDLTCLAAFTGCESNAEPSAATVARLIDRVRADAIPVVLTIEFSNQKLADTICESTGAQKRELHSCHNVTATEFANGATYLSLMQSNLAVLKEALA